MKIYKMFYERNRDNYYAMATQHYQQLAMARLAAEKFSGITPPENIGFYWVHDGPDFTVSIEEINVQ